MSQSPVAYVLPLWLLLSLSLAAVYAASYTDTLDADFLLGNTTAANATGDSVTLNLTAGGVFDTSGTYTSRVFDLGSNPVNITLSWSLSTPTGTSLLLSTRSGPSPTSFSGWTSYSSSYATSTGSAVSSAQNRYYQYRALLATSDNSTTPSLDAVTLAYNEAAANITASPSNGDLSANTSGAYSYFVVVTDTFTPLNVSVRYQLNNRTTTGTFTSSALMTVWSPTLFSIDVPEPAAGWSSFANYTTNGSIVFEVSVNVTNGTIVSDVARNLTEVVQFMNSQPIIDPISNTSVPQSGSFSAVITGSDVDGQPLTFTTNKSAITVTRLTSSSAQLTWTPNATDIGYHAILVTATDNSSPVTRTFYINVTDVNDAPELDDIADITGYHGIRKTIVLTATDLDLGSNLSFSMSPSFFPFTTVLSTSNFSAHTYTQYGLANFTPADPEDGEHNLTFFVTDGYDTVNTSALMTISYCGDNVCDAGYENASACPADCASDIALESVSMVFEDRNCANRTMNIRTFNASNRYTCYYQGFVEGTLAVCEPLDGVTVTVYKRSGTLLTEVSSLSSSSNGTVQFVPTASGEYKFVATKDDMLNSTALVNVRACQEDIVIDSTNVTVEQPVLPPIKDNGSDEPFIDEPGQTRESTSLLSILLFYFMIPILLATLAYTSFVFYDVNKDTLPWILEFRIFLYQQGVKYRPQLERLKALVSPVTTPVGNALRTVYEAALKPTVDKLKNLGKKPKV